MIFYAANGMLKNFDQLAKEKNLSHSYFYRRPLPSTAGDNLNFMFAAGAVNMMLYSNKELGSS